MKFTKTELKPLRVWNMEEKDYTLYYKVVGEEKVTKTITSKLPYETGYNTNGSFPEYLEGYEEYYEKLPYSKGYYSPTHRLKSEYWENRPIYFIDITYTLYEVKFTKAGREYAERRYRSHKRLMERYGKMMMG